MRGRKKIQNPKIQDIRISLRSNQVLCHENNVSG